MLSRKKKERKFWIGTTQLEFDKFIYFFLSKHLKLYFYLEFPTLKSRTFENYFSYSEHFPEAGFFFFKVTRYLFLRITLSKNFLSPTQMFFFFFARLSAFLPLTAIMECWRNNFSFSSQFTEKHTNSSSSYFFFILFRAFILLPHLLPYFFTLLTFLIG